MSDALFQALFSYRPVVFSQGDFRFDPTWASVVGAVLVAVASGFALMTYKRIWVNRGRPRDRVVLTALRVSALALVLFCLFRPTLIVRAAVPQQNVVAVLVDDSRSMQIPDMDGKARAEFVRQQVGDAGSPLMRALSERFLVRLFRFASTPSRVSSVKDLGFAGAETRLATALDGIRDELSGLPVSAVVVISDGADTSEAPMTEALLNMKAQKLPVFAIGVGSQKLPRDIQVDRVSAPRTVLRNASLFLDVVVTNTGYGGETVTVDVEDEGRIVGSEKVQLPRDGSPLTVKVRALASEPGPRMFRFRVVPQQGEVVTQNNQRETMILVRDIREKILYYEGEPRFEMRFWRRGVFDDKNLEVIALQRTADNKFMRLFVTEPDDPNELATGFPTSREELFKYTALVLGSVEAAALTGEQLKNIADFVDVRGGGLLMIGGARSFGEGGYGSTPLADVLPLVMDPRTQVADDEEDGYFARLKVAPTLQGLEHAVTQIEETEAASAARWPQMPLVTTANAPMALKPGATELLRGTDEGGRAHVVLAAQKYGRGKAIALALQDTWTWQMHHTIAVEDQTFERFWRQLIRFLVEGVPGPVDVRTVERVEPGQAVTVEASVVDSTWVDVNDASVVAHITQPDGGSATVPLQWSGNRSGLYRGTFVTGAQGPYEVTVDATRGDKPSGSGSTYVRAAEGEAEFFDPTMHPATLQRMAEETGGRFYQADNFAGIAEDVRYGGRGVTSVEERPLWNMPIILVGLMTLVCAEWGYRRVVGLS
jgi:uncharacterized membrane protein